MTGSAINPTFSALRRPGYRLGLANPAARVFPIARRAVGLVLLASFLLRFDQAVKAPGGVHGQVIHDALASGFSIFEAVVGAALIAGFQSRHFLRGCCLLFAFLAALAMYKGAARQPSCGCFGAFHVNPWLTASFDTASACLFAFAPSRQPRRPARWRRALFAGALAAATTGAWGLDARVARGIVAPKSAGGVNVADFPGVAGSLVVLDADNWTGSPLALARHIDIGPRLLTGSWVLLLVHHDCQDCLSAIPKYTAAAISAKSAIRLAIIEMPPYGDGFKETESAGDKSDRIVFGRLDERREWFATTPVSARIEDGRVLDARQGDASALPPARWWQ